MAHLDTYREVVRVLDDTLNLKRSVAAFTASIYSPRAGLPAGMREVALISLRLPRCQPNP